MNSTRQVLVKLPPRVKRALVRAVDQRGTSINDFVVALLADRYGIPFQGSGRRGHPGAISTSVVLRMDARLKKKIQLDALQAESNMSDRIQHLLAEALGIE